MTEQTLEPIDTGRLDKQGNKIFNLNLKTKVDKATGAVITGLTVGNHIIVEKVFPEAFGLQFGGSAKVKYKDTECSFLVNVKEKAAFDPCGGIGDKIKVSLVSYNYTYEGKEKTANKLTFELIN